MSLYPHESGRTLIFPWMFYYHRGTDEPKELRDEGTSEIQVAALAADNTRWVRESRKPVLSCGPWGSWDSGWLMAASELMRVGDEVWLYYDGGNFTHGFNPKWFQESRTITRGDGTMYTWKYDRQIGLAKWPLDRFVAAEAGPDGGTITTVPLTFAGLNLELNARVREGGQIIVELLDSDGRPLEEFGESDPVIGDGLRQPVPFRAGDLAALTGTSVTLRFHIKDAELYSFAFRK
jgi:hypothetical protein